MSKEAGKTLPWLTVKEAIDGALKTRYIELSDDSNSWPSDFIKAKVVKLRIPKEKPPRIPPPPPKHVLTAKAYLEPRQIQDLADQIPELTKAAAEYDLKYQVQIGFKRDWNKDEAAKRINELLKAISDKFQLSETH